MPNFQFTGQDYNGTPKRGNVIAESLNAAMKDLDRRGITIQTIEIANSVNDPLSSNGSDIQNGAQNWSTPPQSSSPPPQPGGGYGNQSPFGSDNAGSNPYSSGSTHENHFSGSSAQQNQSYNYQHGFQDANYGASSGARPYIMTNVLGPIISHAALSTIGSFFRQLGTMLQAGVPYVQALSTLAGQSHDPRMRVIIEDGRKQVEMGKPLSTALARYPESITPVMLSLVVAGEEGGFLDKALHQASDYVNREIELRNLYRRLTFYPKLIFAFSFVIIAAANAIISAVAPGGKGLATPFTLGTWIILGLIAIGIWLFLKVGLSNYAIKRPYDQFVLMIPSIGKTMHQLAMARFGRSFGALYAGGVPIAKAMKLAADACGNEELRARMYPAFQHMERGASIYDTFRSTGAFSPIVLDMVNTGEKTGNLDDMLTRVSAFYEDEAATKQTILASIVGVVMFLIVAVYIGYIIIHFYTDYYGTMFKEGGLSFFLPWWLMR